MYYFASTAGGGAMCLPFTVSRKQEAQVLPLRAPVRQPQKPLAQVSVSAEKPAKIAA